MRDVPFDDQRHIVPNRAARVIQADVRHMSRGSDATRCAAMRCDAMRGIMMAAAMQHYDGML